MDDQGPPNSNSNNQQRKPKNSSSQSRQANRDDGSGDRNSAATRGRGRGRKNHGQGRRSPNDGSGANQYGAHPEEPNPSVATEYDASSNPASNRRPKKPAQPRQQSPAVANTSDGTPRRGGRGVGGAGGRSKRGQAPGYTDYEQVAEDIKARSEKRSDLSGFDSRADDLYRNVQAAAIDDQEEFVDEAVALSGLSGGAHRALSEVHQHRQQQNPGRRGGRISTDGQTELAAKIINELVRNKYECLVCYSVVKRHVATWSCGNCYAIFHIYCMKKWSQSQPVEGGWSCPKCRHNFKGHPSSLCFCGKVRDPKQDPMIIPHSCGEPCGKTRDETCPHPCTLLCHPGPCPPCSSMGPVRHCHCGKSEFRDRCGVPDNGRSCGSLCVKSLNCGRHLCTDPCHPGPCRPCSQTMRQKCYCGKQAPLRTCGTEEMVDTSVFPDDPRHFPCGDVCDRKLDCGNHTCQEKCHPGPCIPCQLHPSVLHTCPCGKVPVSKLVPQPRKSCLDPVPLCGQVCNKLKKCGLHRCTRPCHEGACDECTVPVEIPCRCGSRKAMATLICKDVYPDNYAKCVEETRCDRVCPTLRMCGRHQCAVKCCPVARKPMDPDGLHICKLTCGKRLGCGSHTCKHPCHRGKCPRCLEATFDDIVCPCGRTTQHAPIVCGTPPLVCTFECTKIRPCGHPNTRHSCHSGDCPNCTYFVDRMCQGGHTMIYNVTCYKQNVSCGKVCGKPMRCGQHHCPRLCHVGECELPVSAGDIAPAPVASEDGSTSEPAESCGHPCLKPLSTCQHNCQSVCHPGRPCPVVVCHQRNKISCSCGRLTQDVPCIGTDTRPLSCDDKCELEKRNRRLAEALGISSESGQAPRYSDLLLNMAKASPMFILKIERHLAEFLKDPLKLKVQLPPMDRVQRQVVHELSKYYNMETESYDLARIEPAQRGVEVTKKKDCRAPIMLLSVASGIVDPAHGNVVAQSTLHPAASSILQIYDLTKSVQTQHLVSFLSPFSGDYHLQWIDDTSCLAVFKDPGKMLRALSQLKGGIFKVAAYTPEAPQPPASLRASSGVVVLGSSGIVSPAPRRAPPQQTSSAPAKKPSWESANPFAALHGDADAPVRKSKWNEKNDQSEWVRAPSPQPAVDVPDDWLVLDSSSGAGPRLSEVETTANSSPTNDN